MKKARIVLITALCALPLAAARGRGLNMAWMTGAKDLAGVDRILDGTVDIGCYECNLPPVGTTVIFR